MAQIGNESYVFGCKPKIAQIKVMTSQTLLMTSSVTSFDRKFERVFDQTKHCKTFFFLALNLRELYCEFSD